ncbi:MAG: FAD:protein FMN transferase [Candidatus Hydrogenedentota bacterium]
MATFAHEAMGTSFEITLAAPSEDMFEQELRRLADKAFDAIDAIEARISTWRETSETSRINARAAREPVPVSGSMFHLLEKAKELHTWTDGAFDVTVGPYLELWGFYKKSGHLPTTEELAEAGTRVGLDKVALDADAETVRFAKAGMRLDFGGIGKGLALERAANVLRAEGVTCAVLHSGTSTVETIGSPPDAAGWTVRIRGSYNEEDGYIHEVAINDESLSTSSARENFLELDGTKYGHIFDPRTGWPVSDRVSATAIGPSGMITDGLSTAFFVMGVQKVRAFCAAHPAYRAVLAVRKRETDAPRVVRINFTDDSRQPSQAGRLRREARETRPGD